MKRSEFQEKYRALYKCLELISGDNNMPMKEEFDLPIFLTSSLDIFEVQAEQLSDDEMTALCIGEDTERDTVIDATGFEYLDDFLSEVYEGILSEFIWVESVYSS